MRILQVHNKYASGVGGEDMVVESERKYLIEHGITVGQYLVSNSEISTNTLGKAIMLGARSIWSFSHYQAIKKCINDFKPDLVHVHNTFAILSPSIFWAIKSMHIPCVLTLHNYRLICPTATLFRDGKICEECIGRFPYPAFLHRCRYNDSFLTVAVNALSQVIHHLISTYKNKIDAFIVLTPGFANIIQRSGFPKSKINVKPNSISDVFSQFNSHISRENQIVFVGQIVSAKGIEFLLETWTLNKFNHCLLIIIGNGPDKVQLQERFSSRSDIVWLGKLDHNRVLEVISRSRFLVMPSLWNEPFGLSAVEALMLATPVILPDHLALAFFAENAGYVYTRNDKKSLSRVLDLSIRINHNDWKKFSRFARQSYLNFFTSENNYKNLSEIYVKVIKDSN